MNVLIDVTFIVKKRSFGLISLIIGIIKLLREIRINRPCLMRERKPQNMQIITTVSY